MRFLILLSMFCAGAAAAAEIPTIELERHGDAWHATYVFAHPVSEMRFARSDAKGNRAALWTPLDEDFAIVLEDGEEVVRRRDGESFGDLVFSMAPRYVPLEKDYAPFSPFGDGGLLIHTGRFFACAPRCDEAASPAWTFSVRAPKRSHVLQGGKVHGRRAEFTEQGSGSNIYVGRAEPIETSHVLAVVDESFPAATRTMLEATFPRLMDFYAGRLGALPGKPMLFASHDAKHPGGGHGHQGGTLPGQVFVHLYGAQPEQANPRAGAEALRGFFAHEAAHLFQRYEAGETEADAWLHEGGAEAFSLLALQELGLADAKYRESQIAFALQQCGRGSKNLVLRESAAKGAFDNYYRCGLLMHLAVDGAARRQSAGSCDLFCVWRAFLARVDAGADWSAETWFAAVDELAGAATGRFLREAAMTAQPAPREFYSKGLEAAGVAP